MSRNTTPRSTKGTANKTASNESVPTAQPDQRTNNTHSQPFFPFARYTSIVGVHTSLLSFTALFLPRTSLSSLSQGLFLSLNNPSDDSSRDSPPPTLTESPLRTVAWLCAGTFILQIWWAGWVRGWSLDTRDLSKGGAALERTEQKLQRQTWNSGRFAAFKTACLLTAVASFFFAIVALLFGAPVFSHFLQTYLLGLLVALLTVFTPAYTLGAPSFKTDIVSLVTRLTWIRLFAEISPRSPVERAVVYPAVGAFLGCWSGAIPAGLDWEEPWQRWPLTTSYGALGGFVIGSLSAFGVSALENLANFDRQSRVSMSPSGSAHSPQGKGSKKLKSQ
ncbi:GPI biosynthesis protein family Pig-F-domain-containing protein [Cristinia sonorae]|uniref:GPI biosynthesis protein family Pig-F-domain-containing protein n=1 Tax=Cristinia sonorae TaxID=1940300 RepID=A0A8K0UQ95_9AGAR|nr:GPI biosynthesis protein family Pig-F-domain-containing protein [Cristinia sonorae]